MLCKKPNISRNRWLWERYRGLRWQTKKKGNNDNWNWEKTSPAVARGSRPYYLEWVQWVPLCCGNEGSQRVWIGTAG